MTKKEQKVLNIIKNTLERLAKIQQKHPLIVILIVLTISLYLGYYAVRIETDSNFNVFFRDDSESRTLERLIDNEFGGTDELFILVQIDNEINDLERIQDIRHPDVLKAINDLKRSLLSETFVADVIGLPDLYLMVYGRLPTTLDESKQMIEDMPQEVKDAYLGSLLSDDFQFQNFFVSVSVEDKPGFLQEIEDNVNEKLEQTPFPIGVKAKLTGIPVLINRIMNYLINDNIKTIFLAILGVFLILWIYFKSWKIALFSIIPTCLTLLWIAGTMHLMDIRITVMIASVGAMLVGISVDYAIHLTHAFHRQVQEGSENVVKDTVVSVGSALFASVATTVAGFVAMLLGVTPNSITQGTVLAIGVAFAFIVTILVLPPLMVLQRKFVYSKLDETVFRIVGRREDAQKKGVIDKLLGLIAAWQVKSPMTVLILVVVLTILIVPGFSLVYLDTSDENWVPDNDDVVESLDNVGNNFGGTESMNLIFTLDKNMEEFDPDAVTDLRDPRVLIPMAQLDNLVEDLKWVNSVDSPTTALVRHTNGRVPRDLEEIKSIITENNDIRERYNKDYSIALFTPRADSIEREEYYDLMSELDGVNFPNEIKIIPQGSVPQDIELEQMLGSDTQRTASIGFLFVIIIASLFYLSIVSGLLAFIPIIVAIIWTVGLMGYVNLPFTVLTTGMLAILMGMGIDFSIHLIHSIREGLSHYKNSIEKAVPYALMSTGQAIAITTITTVLGFMALSFATLVNTRRLGWTLALGIFATFFSCMLIVPAVLSIQHKIKIRRQKNENKS